MTELTVKKLQDNLWKLEARGFGKYIAIYLDGACIAAESHVEPGKRYIASIWEAENKPEPEVYIR